MASLNDLTAGSSTTIRRLRSMATRRTSGNGRLTVLSDRREGLTDRYGVADARRRVVCSLGASPQTGSADG